MALDATPDGLSRIFNLPNLLSLVRIPLAAIFWIAPERPLFVFSVMGAAAVSDLLDGWVARMLRQRRGEDADEGSPGGTGAWLDPVCDKVFVASALVALTVVHRPAVWLVMLAAAREILLVPVMLVYRFVPGPWKRGYDFTAGWPGKATTAAQFAALLSLALGHSLFDAFACLAGSLGTLSVLYYVGRVRWGEQSPDP